jgi:hypothetical protein
MPMTRRRIERTKRVLAIKTTVSSDPAFPTIIAEIKRPIATTTHRNPEDRRYDDRTRRANGDGSGAAVLAEPV